MNITIKLSTSLTETYSSARIVEELYRLSKPDSVTGHPMANLTLVGRLLVPSAYKDAVDFLNELFSSTLDNGSDFLVSVLNNNFYLRFADPEVESVLRTAMGKDEDEGITSAEAATFNISNTFSNNTQITSFNEFPYFTSLLSRATSFSGCTGLQSIDINNCTVFGSTMFYGCSNLEYFNGENSIQGVILIPNGIQEIPFRTFSGCNKITKLIFPDTVTTFVLNALDWMTGLTEVEFGTKPISFGRDCFEHDDNLTKVTVRDLDAWLKSSIASNYASSNPLSLAKHLYLNGTEVTSITTSSDSNALSKYLFYNCLGLQTVNITPNVTSIGDKCFYGCTNISRVNITDLDAWKNIDFSDDYSNPVLYAQSLYLNSVLVTSIDFTGNTQIQNATCCGLLNLTSVTIPNTIISIGNYAFKNCKTLSSITIPNSVTSIGAYAFSGCDGLTSITLPDNLTSVSEGIVYACNNLTSINIPNNVTSIGRQAFRGCKNLASITIPNGVTTIGDFCFFGCKISLITLPDSVTTIKNGCFSSCASLTTVVLSNNLTAIPIDCFEHCILLSSISVPQSVTSVGKEAFLYCIALQNLDLPGLITVDVQAFSSGLRTLCFGPNFTTFLRESSSNAAGLSLPNLTTFKIEAVTPPTLTAKPFPSSSNLQHIYVPSTSVNAYKAATGWSEWASIIEAIPTT